MSGMSRIEALRGPRADPTLVSFFRGEVWSYQTFVEGVKVKRLNERKCPCQRSREEITFGEGIRS